MEGFWEPSDDLLKGVGTKMMGSGTSGLTIEDLSLVQRQSRADLFEKRLLK